MFETKYELKEKKAELGVWTFNFWRKAYPDLTLDEFNQEEKITKSYKTDKNKIINFTLCDLSENVSYFADKVLKRGGGYKRRTRKNLIAEIETEKGEKYDCYVQTFEDDTPKYYRGEGTETEGKIVFSNWEEERKDSKGKKNYGQPSPLGLTYYQASNLLINLEKQQNE